MPKTWKRPISGNLRRPTPEGSCRSSRTSGAILDEIQRVPALLSYLQVLADESGHNSLFVLTGSEQFQLSDAISQSLAWGVPRCFVYYLFPWQSGNGQAQAIQWTT